MNGQGHSKRKGSSCEEEQKSDGNTTGNKKRKSTRKQKGEKSTKIKESVATTTTKTTPPPLPPIQKEEENNVSMTSQIWDEEIHRDFVSSVFDIGLKHCSPLTVSENMKSSKELTLERIKSHLQKYRINKDRSKAEFMKDYDTSLESLQTTNRNILLQSSNVMDSYFLSRLLPKLDTLSSGDVAAQLTFLVHTMEQQQQQVQKEHYNSQQNPNHDAGEKSSLEQKAEQSSKNALLPIPSLTYEEKCSPIGVAFECLTSLFQQQRKQLMLQRGQKMEQQQQHQQQQQTAPSPLLPSPNSIVWNNHNLQNKIHTLLPQTRATLNPPRQIMPPPNNPSQQAISSTSTPTQQILVSKNTVTNNAIPQSQEHPQQRPRQEQYHHYHRPHLNTAPNRNGHHHTKSNGTNLSNRTYIENGNHHRNDATILENDHSIPTIKNSAQIVRTSPSIYETNARIPSNDNYHPVSTIPYNRNNSTNFVPPPPHHYSNNRHMNLQIEFTPPLYQNSQTSRTHPLHNNINQRNIQNIVPLDYSMNSITNNNTEVAQKQFQK